MPPSCATRPASRTSSAMCSTCAKTSFRGETWLDAAHVHREAIRWCTEIAGTRIHGTTRRAPARRASSAERAALQPLDRPRFDPPTWVQCKVHPDHHIQSTRPSTRSRPRTSASRLGPRRSQARARLLRGRARQDACPAGARRRAHRLRRLSRGARRLRHARSRAHDPRGPRLGPHVGRFLDAARRRLPLGVPAPGAEALAARQQVRAHAPRRPPASARFTSI